MPFLKRFYFFLEIFLSMQYKMQYKVKLMALNVRKIFIVLPQTVFIDKIAIKELEICDFIFGA